MTAQRMIKVSVQVRNGTARFRVSVQAESIKRALGLVGGRCPHGEVRAVFSAEPRRFFTKEPVPLARTAGSEPLYKAAA